MDLAERLEALKLRNAETYADDEAKDVFLSGLEEGMTIPEAARAAGRTATWFRRRRAFRSEHFDEDFTDHYDAIMGTEGPNREALALRAFTALVKAADEGNVRAIEKILGAYHGDFQWLRPVAASGDINIERFVQIMPGIPTELLLEMKKALEAGEQGQLPVIEQ